MPIRKKKSRKTCTTWRLAIAPPNTIATTYHSVDEPRMEEKSMNVAKNTNEFRVQWRLRFCTKKMSENNEKRKGNDKGRAKLHVVNPFSRPISSNVEPWIALTTKHTHITTWLQKHTSAIQRSQLQQRSAPRLRTAKTFAEAPRTIVKKKQSVGGNWFWIAESARQKGLHGSVTSNNAGTHAAQSVQRTNASLSNDRGANICQLNWQWRNVNFFSKGGNTHCNTWIGMEEKNDVRCERVYERSYQE